MYGGDTADTQVDGLVTNLDLDSSILRDAFLGNIHRAGHDLKSADDGTLEFFGWALDLLKISIDAVTDAEPLFHRLDVDVARSAVLGFDQDVGDHPDNGSRVITRDILFLGDRDRLSKLLQSERVEAVQLVVNLCGDCTDKFHGSLEKKAKAVECLEIHRIGNG